MKKIIQLSILLFISSVANAASKCPAFFENNTTPVISTADQTTEICFDQYAVLFNLTKHTAVYSAEMLTAGIVTKAKGMKRINAFHVDTAVDQAHEASLKDYVSSGYDRGHLTPFGDMATAQAGYQSFALTNMVPQVPHNNEHVWKNIEIAVRNLAAKKGKLYIVTGPVFTGTPKMLNSRVPIPAYMFKAVYVPSTGEASVILSTNQEKDQYTIISLDQFKTMSGIDVFPGLTPAQKAAVIQLVKVSLDN